MLPRHPDKTFKKLLNSKQEWKSANGHVSTINLISSVSANHARWQEQQN